MVVNGSEVFVVGSFTSPSMAVARFDSNGISIPMPNYHSGTAFSLAINGNNLYVGGGDSFATWNVVTGLWTSPIAMPDSQTVDCILPFHGVLYLGLLTPNPNLTSLLIFNGVNFQNPVVTSTNTASQVRAIYDFNDVVYIGGSFAIPVSGPFAKFFDTGSVVSIGASNNLVASVSR